MKTLDQKINEMKPSESILVSEYNGIKVTCERSGDGKKVRFVRHIENTSIVFKVANF